MDIKYHIGSSVADSNLFINTKFMSGCPLALYNAG